MARIEDLIDEIADPGLRDEIARQVKLLKSTKRFGLVFEDHVPETVSLHGLSIRPGSVVQNRRKSEEATRFRVLSVEDGKATTAPVGLDEPVETGAIEDLLVVKAFEEPTFPGLTPLGEVRRGPEDKPAHTVINGENFHALQLLASTHAGKVDVIYIDPPYNTGARDWKYNNRFVDNNDAWRHSKWLAMMEKRLKLARKILDPLSGVLMITIDDNELHSLSLLLDEVFRGHDRQLVSITVSPRGKSRDGRLSQVDEYLLITYLGSAAIEPLPSDARGKPVRWRYLRREDVESARGTVKGGPRQFYPIYVDATTKRIVEIGEPLNSDQGLEDAQDIEGAVAVFPIRDDGKHMNWGLTRPSLRKALDEGFVRVTVGTHENQPFTIAYLTRPNIERIDRGEFVVAGTRDDGSKIVIDPAGKRVRPTTAWREASHDAGAYGTSILRSLLGDRHFPYPKSLYAVADSLRLALHNLPDAVVLDFFAGSGTTLHAVALLNAQDGGNRQCILVTNNDVSEADAKRLNKAGHFAGDPEFEAEGIFESVTRPRLEAAITGVRPDGAPVEGKYLDQYLPDHSYAAGFQESVAFFRMDYLEPDLVELGRQYNAIVPLLWMAAGSVGSWEEWDGKRPWSSPGDSTYAVLFDPAEAAAFAAMVESRPEISRVWVVTDSHSAFVEARAELPAGVEAGQLYREYLRNFTLNAPGVLE